MTYPDHVVDAALAVWLPTQGDLHLVPVVRGTMILCLDAPTIDHALDVWDNVKATHKTEDPHRLELEDQAPYLEAEPRRTVKARREAMHAARDAARAARSKDT